MGLGRLPYSCSSHFQPSFILYLSPPLWLCYSHFILFYSYVLYSLLFHLPGTLFLTLQLLVETSSCKETPLSSPSTVDSSLISQYFLLQNSAISLHSIYQFLFTYWYCLFTSYHFHWTVSTMRVGMDHACFVQVYKITKYLMDECLPYSRPLMNMCWFNNK